MKYVIFFKGSQFGDTRTLSRVKLPLLSCAALYCHKKETPVSHLVTQSQLGLDFRSS